MPSKSSRTPKSKEKPTSGSPSLNRKSTSLPKTKPPHANPHYLVVDTTIPFHIFSDRSLFTTYVPSRKLYRNVFGTNIIIEGIGDVHVRVVVRGTSIMFRFRDAWHIPSSPHHFLSCSTLVSLGHQVMIAGRSPRMIYSHKRRLVEPTLPKYIPFTWVDGLLILTFDIPVQPEVFLPPQPVPTITHPTSQTTLSLPASLYRPFAGLSFDQNLLSSPNPQYIPDSLGKILPVQVVTVDVNGGAVSAVAGVVDGVSAHVDDVDDVVAESDGVDVVVDDGGAAHDVVDVVVADGGAAHELAPDVTVVVDEPDHGVAVVIDHGGEIVDCAVVDCAPPNVDVAIVSLDSDTVDGEGNQRLGGTKLIVPDSSTLVSLTNPNPNLNPLPSFHIPSSESSYNFRAAFPNASDSEEKLEVAWTTDTYDLSGNNGSTRDFHITRLQRRLAGVWDDVSYMSAAAMDAKFVRTRRPMGPRSIRSMSPTGMPPSTLLSSESPCQIFPAKPTLSPPVNQSAFLRPSLSLSIPRPYSYAVLEEMDRLGGGAGGAVHHQATTDVGTRGVNGGVDNRVVEATDVVGDSVLLMFFFFFICDLTIFHFISLLLPFLYYLSLFLFLFSSR
jgi:hypothetical protein